MKQKYGKTGIKKNNNLKINKNAALLRFGCLQDAIKKAGHEKNIPPRLKR